MDLHCSWWNASSCKTSPRRNFLVTGEGWEVENETTAETGDVRAISFNRGELGATAVHHRKADDAHLVVMVSSPCLDHPAEHRMVRSELDPEYGHYSQYYDDGGPRTGTARSGPA